jgi:hypothetical protein
LATDAEKDPVVSCTLWEDERCVVTQVLVNGHVVARRSDLDYVNCTKLLNVRRARASRPSSSEEVTKSRPCAQMVPGLTRGKRDMYLKVRLSRVASGLTYR